MSDDIDDSDEDERLSIEEANELAVHLITGMTMLLLHGYTRSDLEGLVKAAEGNV